MVWNERPGAYAGPFALVLMTWNREETASNVSGSLHPAKIRLLRGLKCVRENYKQFLSSSRHPDGR